MGDVPINNSCLHFFIYMLYVYVNVQDVRVYRKRKKCMNVFYMRVFICFNECVCIYVYVYKCMWICGFVCVLIYQCFWYVGVLREIIFFPIRGYGLKRK